MSDDDRADESHRQLDGMATVDAELRQIYDDLDAAVAEARPVCELSGRCCRFKEYGHTLFVTQAEFSYLVRRGPLPVRSVDSGESCPWQDERGRCVARDARPLGCRVYFCDPAYEEMGPILSERFIARLKAYVERHGLGWNYAPLHHHLHGEAFMVGCSASGASE